MEINIRKKDYLLTTTIEKLEAMSPEEYTCATICAEKELRRLLVNYEPFGTGVEHKIRCRGKEIAYINSKYKDTSDNFKTVLSANISLSNNVSIIECLVRYGYTYNSLRYIVYLIERMNRASLKVSTFDEDDLFNDEQIMLSNKHLIKLIKIFRLYNSTTDYVTIANKIMELFVFQKDLYLNIENKKFNTKTKTR